MIWACAKVNLSLRVSARRDDGLHPIHGLFQSVSWTDRLQLVVADEDEIVAPGGRPVPDGMANLAWRALLAVRAAAGVSSPARLELEKRIPVAAGLGGGSADAAAALAAGGRRWAVPDEELARLAPALGSDVPFCLRGGTAFVSGVGERVQARPDLGGFALAIVVPPVELATADVYRRWDELGGPVSAAMRADSVPPALRHEELGNDLAPAAADLAPPLAEWRRELEGRWGREVAVSGSGPALCAFFLDTDEATAALADCPVGARATRVVVPVGFGWAIDDGDGLVLARKGRPEASEADRLRGLLG